MSRLRYKLARLLDRSSRFCWADLCTWASMGTGTLRGCMTSDRCEADRLNDGSCYCSKFRTPPLICDNCGKPASEPK